MLFDCIFIRKCFKVSVNYPIRSFNVIRFKICLENCEMFLGNGIDSLDKYRLNWMTVEHTFLIDFIFKSVRFNGLFDITVMVKDYNECMFYDLECDGLSFFFSGNSVAS